MKRWRKRKKRTGSIKVNEGREEKGRRRIVQKKSRGKTEREQNGKAGQKGREEK